ncbi:ATP-dependent RNA helicase DDX51-like [Anneissia japonica]|uniref:ATP-dependent RNA helicase DDX51-like n=1 Tax=Anneissia japonica TaxID=1529436 RepID=UPI001425AF5B|nr:ATP-dependent RNA helicase DDX51-like [Anneissia japonica]
MALFSIKRFQGERIIDSDSNTTNQQLLLEKLNQKIQSRLGTYNDIGAVKESNYQSTSREKRKRKSTDNKNKDVTLSISGDDNLKTKKNIGLENSESKKRKHCKLKTDFTDVNDSIRKQKKRTSKSKVKSVEKIDQMVESSKDKNEDDEVKHSFKSVEDTTSKNYDAALKQSTEKKIFEENDDDEEMIDEESMALFTVLGDVESKKKKKVQRVLPDWLAWPTVVDHDIKRNLTAITDLEGLDERMLMMLRDNGINHFFPVQSKVIPVVFASLKFGLHVGNIGYRPRDICVSAPTGSGKTLAFVIPIVQSLLDRIVPEVRALVVLPTKELADQVYTVFSTYCRKPSLKVVLIGGSKPFAKEQEQLVRQRSDGSICSLVDIAVATPGRLVDHINLTAGFTLQHLRFLVIDEADRMMDNISKNWIKEVEKCAYPGEPFRPAPSIVTPSSVSIKFPPLQKLLFSATLSQNPEKLTQLNLFHPELLTSVIKTKGHEEMPGDHDNKGEFVGKYTTPVELTEFMINCTAGEKPLIILHLILKLSFNNILCFTNTVEQTHRLYLLVKAIGGIKVEEFSSQLSKLKRAEILKKFKAGKIQILIASDAMARGMDVDNVRCVISYDVPPFIKTYIHRVGRTARAGKAGIAFSLVQKSEVTKFKCMLSNVGKKDVQTHRVKREQLAALEDQYENALYQLKSILKEEKSAQYAM